MTGIIMMNGLTAKKGKKIKNLGVEIMMCKEQHIKSKNLILNKLNIKSISSDFHYLVY